MGDLSTSESGRGRVNYGFFQRILALFFGSDDLERERRRLLKQVGKELSRNKRRFYKPRTGEALPNLARFFFDIYKVVGPAQTLLLGADSSKALKIIVIESRHSPDQARLREELEESTIRNSSDSMTGKQLVAHVKDALVGYQSGFDSATVKEINDLYNIIQSFTAFLRFDFYFVLRKFDAGIQEGNFGYTPRFDTISAEYVSDDVKDFLEVVMRLDGDADWESALDVLQEYKGVDVVSRPAWKKLLNLLTSVVRSGVLVKIVQHIDHDPYYQPEVKNTREHIVEGYLTLMKTQVEAALQKVGRERRTRKVDRLLTEVFGTTAISRAKYYTEAANTVFTKRMLAGYTHTEAINYLKAFLIDYFKGEVRVMVSDLLIVRGRWADSILSQQLSDSYYSVMNIAQQIVEFDDSLGEEGELGIKLKKASARVVEKDKATMKLLRQALHEINDIAVGMINDTGTNLITIGRILKLLVEDLNKDHPELIQNWKDLEGYAEHHLKDRLLAVYRRIYYFIQLLQMFTKK
jgi:hypothetical protein